jgi:hypothetical protein
MKIDEFRLKEAIASKFGSQAKFAKKMGLTEGQVSRGIKVQPAKFMVILREAGINIDSLLGNEEWNKKENIAFQLKIADKRIKELENVIESQKNLIASQKDLIASYELILKRQLTKPE